MPQIPNFSQEEYISAAIFDSAFSQVASGIANLASGNNSPFFICGVVNPASLTITTNNTLTVSVTAQNYAANPTAPFKCLFSSGFYTDAHGVVNGTDSDVYSVSFASLIPGSGSVTAYIVAQYTTVQLSQIVITGPPPGHPDYSSSFVPYTAYTTVQDTLNIFATTTVPDNKTTIELARTTLTAGQTSVSTLNTSFQVLASVVASAVSLGGDVTGAAGSNIISNLQGKPVSASNPSTNTVLTFNGSEWVAGASPAGLPPTGNAGGDLTGSYPNPEVLQSSVSTFTVQNSELVKSNLTVNGTINGGSTIAAVGNLIGANATAIGQALILGQMAGGITGANTGTTSRYLSIPVLDTTSETVINLIIQWGFYSWYGLSPTQVQNVAFPINFPLAFPTQCVMANASFGTNDTTNLGAMRQDALILEIGMTASSVLEPLSLTQLTVYADWANSTDVNTRIASSTQNGITGIYWWACGF